MWRIEINFASADKLSILFFADFYIRKTYMILLLCDIFCMLVLFLQKLILLEIIICYAHILVLNNLNFSKEKYTPSILTAILYI